MKNHKAGFTLIEVIVALFSAVFILGAFISLFLLHGSLYNQQQASVRTSEGLRNGTQTLQLYASQAYRVLASRDFSGVAYDSGDDALILQLPAIDAQTNILPGKWDYALFYLSGDKLFLRVETDQASSRTAIYKLLAENVSNFLLTYDSADFALVKNITAELQTRVDIKGEAVTAGVTQQVNLLNY